MNHDRQCPLCGTIKDTDNIKLCKYHYLTLKYPEFNWKEAEEQSFEDLEAAAACFDRLIKPLYKKNQDGPDKMLHL